MSLSQAVAFVQAVADSPEIQGAIVRQIPDARSDLSDLVDLGRRHGFQFTETQLRQAVARDWWMRWVHVHRHHGDDAPENQEA